MAQPRDSTGATLSATQIANLAYQAGFRGADIVIAVAVCLAESGGRTDATNHNSNGSIDEGLMQINSVHTELSGNRFDPLTNMKMAYAIKTRRGSWKDWSTFNSGRYALYMPTARVAVSNMGTSGVQTVSTDTVTNVDGSGGTSGAVNTITNPHTWLRLAMITSGAILVLVSLALLGWNNTPESVKKVAKTATEVAAVIPK